MFQALSHAVQVIRALAAGRSSRWPAARGEHVARHPTCAACGGTKQLNVHHILPFHLFPELELAPENLITLCEKKHCHFVWGHLNANWKTWNESVSEDARRWLRKVERAPGLSPSAHGR
jgi:5-methylcytosine-specific restriction endonuclease McrA